MNKKLVIGIDIDGVLRNFGDALRKAYKEEYPDHVIKPLTTWDLHDKYPIGKEIYKFCWETHAMQCLFHAYKFDGAREFMEAICLDDNHEVYLITTQPTPQAKQWTFEWIMSQRFLDLVDGIIFISGGGVVNKGSIRGMDILIDDYIKNLNDALNNGIYPMCIKRPWNGDWHLGRRTLEEIPDAIINIEINRENVSKHKYD